MPKPQIFISHSANNDAAAEDLLEKLIDRLCAREFDVKVDRTRLQAGDLWRRQLHLWMLQCHGAVVLFSKKALESEWVYYESTILTARRYQQPDFRLLPVMLPDFDKADPNWKRFSPMQLDETQRVRKGTIDEIVDEVERRFADLKPSFQDTPFEKIEFHMREWLNPVSPTVLRATAERLYTQDELNGTTTPALPLDDPVRLVIEGLLKSPLATGINALEILALHLPAGQAEHFSNILTCLWVDAGAAAVILDVMQRPPAQRSVSVNGRDPKTGKMYIRRARSNPADWLVLSVTNRHGEDAVGGITREIRELFKKETDDDATDEYIDDSLIYTSQHEPVFVVIPGFLDMDDLAALREKYQHVTFFLLPGYDMQDQSELLKYYIEFLKPPLTRNDEMEASRLYLRAKRLLKPGS